MENNENEIPKKYDGCESVRLFLHDEAEYIGTGFRTVLAKVGYKWVYLYHIPTASTKRLTRSAYDNILRQTQERIRRNGNA